MTSFFKFFLTGFFNLLFKLIGNPASNVTMKNTVELYEGGGFAQLFTQIRLWDTPFDLIDRYVSKSGLILDLGCGDGFLSNYLALSSKRRRLIGIELNKDRIKQANKGLRNTKFKFGDITHTKLPKVDTIILIHVLHHLLSGNDQEKLLQNCYRSLKRNGKIIILEIDKAPFLKFILTYFTDVVIVPILFEKRIYNFNINYRSKKDWIELFRKIGFKTKTVSAHRSKPFSHVLLELSK